MDKIYNIPFLKTDSLQRKALYSSMIISTKRQYFSLSNPILLAELLDEKAKQNVPLFCVNI